MLRKSKPGEEGKFDFQIYFISLKCLVFNNKKISRHTKNRNVWPIQKKMCIYKSIETILKERPDERFTRQRL